MLISSINNFKNILPAKNKPKNVGNAYCRPLPKDTVSFGNSREEIIDTGIKLIVNIFDEVNQTGTKLSLGHLTEGEKIFEYCTRALETFKSSVKSDAKAAKGENLLSIPFEEVKPDSRIYKVGENIERSVRTGPSQIIIDDFTPGIKKRIYRTRNNTKTTIQNIKSGHFSEITHNFPTNQIIFEFSRGKTGKFAITLGEDGSIYDVARYISPKEKEYILIASNHNFEARFTEDVKPH